MAFPAETAPSQGFPLPGQAPDGLWPQDFSARKESPVSFSHPMQERIANEWRPLILEHGEGCPVRRVQVVGERADRFASLTGGLTSAQLDGSVRDDTLGILVRYASYLKISVIDAATSMRVDIGSFMDKKMLEKMQIKYPPDAVYSLIGSGMTPFEAMAYLKNAYNNGLEPLIPYIEISEEEREHRADRRPAFLDAYQDVTDTWQRRTFGKHLRAGERLPNLYGEIAEFMDEFNGLTSSEVNSLASNTRVVTADEELGSDPIRNKLIAIGGEAADVVIADDGYTAALGRDQDTDGNAALDRMISKYRKTKRLVRLGLSEPEAIALQRTVEERQRKGLRPPYVSIPAAAAIVFGV